MTELETRVRAVWLHFILNYAACFQEFTKKTVHWTPKALEAIISFTAGISLGHICSYATWETHFCHFPLLLCCFMHCHNPGIVIHESEQPLRFREGLRNQTCSGQWGHKYRTKRLNNKIVNSVGSMACCLTNSSLFFQIFFWMWTIFKVFIEFVTISLLFYVLGFWPQGLWDLSFPIRDQTCRKWSPNHWTTGDILTSS